MPLDIEIKGDPAALRATAQWLRTTGSRTHEAAADVRRANADSIAGEWTGTASNGFRRVMSKARTGVEQVAHDLNGTSAALYRHADELADCKAQMSRARDIAASAGLQNTATSIAEPGAPPSPPAGGPPTGSWMQARVERPTGPYSAGFNRQFDAYEKAFDAYLGKARAYLEAAKIVSSSREEENAAQRALIDYLKATIHALPFHLSNFGAGLAGEIGPVLSEFRNTVEEMRKAALIAASHLTRLQKIDLSGARLDSATRRAIILQTEAQRHADELDLGVFKAQLSRAYDSPWGQRLLPLHEGSGKLTGVPIAGWLIAGVAIGYATYRGQNLAHAAVSNVTGTLAAAGTTALLVSAGGPPGWAVAGGVLVGGGVGFAIDTWGDDAARGIADGAVGIRDSLKSFAFRRP